MAKTVKAQLKCRHDTAANWTAKNPVLLDGELGVETDTTFFKIGDGATAWTALKYVTSKSAVTATKLHTARTISLTGDITGSATFDGSSNISINTSKPYVVGETKRYTVNLSTLDTTKFYPIIFNPDDIILRCEIHSPDFIDSAQYNQNTISFSLLRKGWSDTGYSFSIDTYNTYKSEEITIGCIGVGVQGGYICVWVRGGLYYHIVSNRKPILYTKDITFTGDGTETYTVGTNYYGGTGNNNVSIIFTPQQTITSGSWHDGMAYGLFEKATKDASGNVITDTYPTKTGGGASGTWGINISGNAASATKANQDASGNVIANTYATKDYVTKAIKEALATATITYDGKVTYKG